MLGGMYTKLAKSAAEHFVRSQELLPVPLALPAELQRQRACYVWLFENPGRHLRAGHGTLLPQQAVLAQEIIANTVTAIMGSSFHRIRRADLSSLVYSVAVIGPLERVSSAEKVDPTHFGLQVRSDRGKIATILPRRSGVETGQEQLATALREARIDLSLESITLYRFPVDFYE